MAARCMLSFFFYDALIVGSPQRHFSHEGVQLPGAHPHQTLGMSTFPLSSCWLPCLFSCLREGLFQNRSPQRKTAGQNLLFQRLQISFSYRLQLFDYLEDRLFRLLQQGCLQLLVRFHNQGGPLCFSVLLTDEDTTLLPVCLQLFHTPLFLPLSRTLFSKRV
jgi:hypothetical protein